MTDRKLYSYNKELYQTITTSLVIKASKLNFSEIEKELVLKPTRITLNGESMFEGFEPNNEDSWIYELPICNNLSLTEHFEEIGKILRLHKNYFQKISSRYELFVQCTYQVDIPISIFAIPNHILKLFANYNVNLEVMVISHSDSKDEDIIKEV